jgi:hypothetical protein
MAKVKVRLIATGEVVAELFVENDRIGPACLVSYQDKFYAYHRLCGTTQDMIAEFLLVTDNSKAICYLFEEDLIK